MKTRTTQTRGPDLNDSPCPCGGAPDLAGHARQSSRTAPAGRAVRTVRYGDCCGRFIEDGQLPATAEHLMRSRYTAYVLERFDYLRETWDPVRCPADLGAEPGPQWLGLEVCAHHQHDDRHATVEFIARYKTGGRAHRLHEVSRFTRGDDGRWRYVDADVSTS
jgi:SEC-C motif domain protein